MAKIITVNIRVEIKDINVGDMYFDFKYRVLVENRIHTDWTDYENDHSWGNDKPAFRKMLKNGHALDLVMENIEFAK